MKYQNVLHVDDDQDDLEIFSITVGEFKPAVTCVSLDCAVTALDKIKSHEISPEAIFLDLNMPGMNGFEFLAEVKKLPEFKGSVFVLSTSSQPEAMETVKDASS